MLLVDDAKVETDIDRSFIFICPILLEEEVVVLVEPSKSTIHSKLTKYRCFPLLVVVVVAELVLVLEVELVDDVELVLLVLLVEELDANHVHKE